MQKKPRYRRFFQPLGYKNLNQIYLTNQNSYINEFILFTSLFNRIPNFIPEQNINCQKARLWFEKTYQSEIRDKHFKKAYFDENRRSEIDDILFILFEDLIVYFDTRQSEVSFLFKKTNPEKVEELNRKIRKFKKRKIFRPEISLLVLSNDGFEIKSLDIIKPKLKIEDNYNDSFNEIHKTILKRLSRKNDKGLVLLHGKPGTGKTSYIHYLITTVKKKIIFLPPNMARAITNPDLITVLIDNPNSIFVIEDAENIIIDREKEGNSPVSTLLNISDGLLSDCLNIQVVCSFNTDITKIDKALMRKGRLIAKYEFKELEIKKANELSLKLGHNANFVKPATLTAIYNQGEMEFQDKKISKIGF